MILKLKTPKYLKKGDVVALVAPAGLIKDEKPLVLAEQLLQSWGLKSKRGQFVLEQQGVFAGTDAQRLEDLQAAFDDKKVKAIWAVRGGYGSVRLLEKLNFSAFEKHPKWLIGFSDITALHSVLHRRGFKSIHGLMPVQLLHPVKETEKAVNSLYHALFGQKLACIFPTSPYNRPGNAIGVLVGGNLSILQSLIGSPYEIDTSGKILFLEEVSEYKYRIDRMLQHFKIAGVFKNLKALIIGDFTDVKESEVKYGKEVEELILEAVKDYDYPVVFDLPVGHIPDNQSLILGEKTSVNVGEFVSCISFDR